MTVAELRRCVARDWTPQIGDPEITGWLTVAAYVTAAVLALLTWRRLKGRKGRLFWLFLAVMLAFLSVNKQLDLQTAATMAGRCIALTQDWYDRRRVLQAGFIAVILAAAVLFLIVMLRALRGGLARSGLALVGLVILLAFIMIRAASFHQFDHLIGMRQFGVPNNFLFENAGLLLIALNALLVLRRPGRGR